MRNSARRGLVLALAGIIVLAACQVPMSGLQAPSVVPKANPPATASLAPGPVTPLPSSPPAAVSTAPQIVVPTAPSPAAQPTLAADLARLDVQADPPGAQVSVDGLLRGASPLTLTLPAGVHQLLLAASGYLTLSEPLTLTAGQEGIYSPSLTPLAQTAGQVAGAGEKSAATVPTAVPRPASSTAAATPFAAEPDTVSYRVETVVIPTYPYTRYLRSVTDPNLADYPVLVFDRQAYEAAKAQPVPVPYKLAVLENRYLRVSVLPELGGRIYEAVYKPTGNDELYKNPVIKPTSWGPAPPGSPAGANWWPAAGGLEWGFPAPEHGYEAATPWGYDHAAGDDGSQTITVFTRDYQRPYVTVGITLAPGSAAFTVHPTIVNPTGAPFRFEWWDNALVAPGPGNTVGQNLRFVVPIAQVTVHSTGDPSLPLPGQPMSWPIYADRDLSWLGNWHAYLGFFARPAAAAGFAAVYDTSADEGLVRVFPPDVARGVKGFAIGFTQPLDPAIWTDDGSSYAELHGGLTPTFNDWTELPPGGQVDWSETWYPAAGIRGLVYATEAGALNLSPTFGGLLVALQPTRPIAGRLQISAGPGGAPITRAVDLAPGRPFVETVPGDPGPVTMTLTDTKGTPVLTYAGTVR